MSALFLRFGPIVLLALSAIAGCSSGDSSSNADKSTPVGRTFVSTRVEGTPIPGGGPLTLTFTGDKLTVTLLDKKVAQPDKPIKGTTWVVTGLITPDAQIRSRTIDEAKPTLTIADDGAVSGTAGCNRMGGKADVAAADITFHIATTKMLCSPEIMEVEQSVLKALDGKTTATVDAEVLTLRNTNGSGLTLRAS